MSDTVSKMQVFKENGWNFQTFGAEVDNEQTEEKLLPAGYRQKEEEEEEDVQVNEDKEILPPTGIDLEE